MKRAALNNEVSFHDSTLKKVEEHNGGMILRFDFASAHPSFLGEPPGDEYVVLGEAVIHCSTANTRKLEYWTDTVAAKEHPAPNHPLYEVLENNLEDGGLELSGLGPNSNWVVWQIEASEFTIEWSHVTRYKAPQAEQAGGGQAATRAEST